MTRRADSTAQTLKRERLRRGMTRRELDRERHQIAQAGVGRPRPQFWWIRRVYRG